MCQSKKKLHSFTSSLYCVNPAGTCIPQSPQISCGHQCPFIHFGWPKCPQQPQPVSHLKAALGKPSGLTQLQGVTPGLLPFHSSLAWAGRRSSWLSLHTPLPSPVAASFQEHFESRCTDCSPMHSQSSEDTETGPGAVLPQLQALSSAHLSLPAGAAAGSVAPLPLVSLAHVSLSRRHR